MFSVAAFAAFVGRPTNKTIQNKTAQLFAKLRCDRFQNVMSYLPYNSLIIDLDHPEGIGGP
mgnify:CR=1 FL=1